MATKTPSAEKMLEKSEKKITRLKNDAAKVAELLELAQTPTDVAVDAIAAGKNTEAARQLKKIRGLHERAHKLAMRSSLS